MLPYRDINPTRRFAWVTLGLILVNAFVFLFLEPVLSGNQGAQQAYFLCHAEIPYEVTHQTSLAQGGAAAAHEIAQDFGIPPDQAAQVQGDLRQLCPHKSWLASVFEAMFLHGGWLHIAGNMLYLWVFGNNVEDRLGRLRYLVFYLAGGLAAAALELAFGPNSAVPNLGASGAIAAVLGSYLVLFPRAKVRTLVLGFIPATFRAEIVLGLWFVMQLFDGVGGLGTHVNGGVAYWAHVGGFLFGVITTLALFRGGAGRSPAPDGYAEPGFTLTGR
jgi:membrane associated rhomboid family serine protease